MADSKLVDMTELDAGDVDVDDLLYIVHDPAGTPVDRKVKIGSLPTSSGGGILAVTKYDPVSQADLDTTSTASADVDATHLSVTFVVPDSGQVVVELNAMISVGNSTFMAWSIREGAADVAPQQGVAFTTSGEPRINAKFFITGLTPGASKTYKWGFARTFGSNLCRISIGQLRGAATMVVSSA